MEEAPGPAIPVYTIAVVGGTGGVGKSALTIQLLQQVFVEEYDVTIEDYYHTQKLVDHERCTLEITDTAGEEEYQHMRKTYIQRAQSFLLVYSITSRSSFDEASEFRRLIVQYQESNTVPMVLVGNKSDLECDRSVTTTEGRQLAASFGCPFFETSAKRRINVDEAFYELVREIRRAQQPQPQPPPQPTSRKTCVLM